MRELQQLFLLCIFIYYRDILSSLLTYRRDHAGTHSKKFAGLYKASFDIELSIVFGVHCQYLRDFRE